MDSIMEYVMHDALVLVLPLWVIGKLLKELNAFPDKWIPLCLLPFGIIGAICMIGATAEAVIQGILVTGAAVYGNQVLRQWEKKE